MPIQHGYLDPVKRLDSNVNYYTDNPYQEYPSEKNERLSQSYIDFIKYEFHAKGVEAKPLPFLTSDHLLFTSSSQAIDLIIRTFCEPGIDKVCVLSPTFPLYAYCALNHNAPLVDIPLLGENYDRLDLERIKKENPKVVFIPSPNNPVGSLPSSHEIQIGRAHV